MISIKEAQEIIWNGTQTLGVEKVNILESMGRVLAEDIFSPFDMPLFNRAAMDGYAINTDDFVELEPPFIVDIVDEIRAGERKKVQYEKGRAITIMTGAIVPNNYNAVVKFEDTEEIECKKRKIKILKKAKEGENIAKMGEDFREGELLVEKGKIIDPAVLAIIAYTGKDKFLVYKRPTVGIIATGDEIKKIGTKLEKAEIYDCNSYSIYGLVLKYGGVPQLLGVAKDNDMSLREYIEKGLNKNILILSGGVSEGEYDIVVDVLTRLGIKMKFWKIAVKPGKPTFFGEKDNCLIFGLPGYPVSCYVNFEYLVRTAIARMQGQRKPERFKICGILNEDIENKDDRDAFVRVNVFTEKNENIIAPFYKQKSGVFTSIVKTNGLLLLSKGEKLKKGEKVTVEIYRQL